MITENDSILMPSFETIPGELKDRGRFIVWRKEPRGDGTFKKVPYNPITGESKNSLSASVDFKEAVSAYESGRFDGIGFYCTNDIGFIDLDSCILSDGSLTEFAREIVETVNSYTEYSPSGKGLHIVFRIDRDELTGGKPFDEVKKEYKEKYKEKKPEMEFYLPDFSLRYSTLTGKGFEQYGHNPVRIQETDTVKAILNKYMLRDAKKASIMNYGRNPEKEPRDVDEIDDETLLQMIRDSKQGKLFTELFDTPIDPGTTGESENDLRLSNILCWWTCQDVERTRRLMFKSQRVRDKWTKHKQYMDWTLQESISSMIPGDGFTGKPFYINQKGYVTPYTLGAYIMETYLCYKRDGMFFKYDDVDGYYKRITDDELTRIFFDACINDANKTATRADEFLKTFYRSFEDKEKSYDEKSLIACGNGVINIADDSIIPYSPDYEIECKFKPNYDESITEDEFEQSTFYKFLSDSIPNKQTQETIQEMLGLVLSPHAKEVQKCFFLHGSGANGKSVLIDIIRALFKYPKESICSLSLSDFAKSFGFESVKSSFLNIVSDEQSDRIERLASILKSFVAGDSITVEEKFKPRRDNVLTNVTSIYGLNSLPTSADKTFGFERRPCIIPFKVRFGNPEEIEAGTAHKLKDRTLINKIVDNPRELELVFWWAIQGLKRLKANEWELSESPECKEAKNEYIRENNSAEEFFQECLIRDPKAEPIKIQDMHDAYKSFCAIEGIDRPLGRNTFNRHLKDGKGLKKDRISKGVCWFGVRFADNELAHRVLKDMLWLADQHA